MSVLEHAAAPLLVNIVLNLSQSDSCEDTPVLGSASAHSDAIKQSGSSCQQPNRLESISGGPVFWDVFFFFFFPGGGARLSKLSICNCGDAVNVEESVSACYQSPHPPDVNALSAARKRSCVVLLRLESEPNRLESFCLLFLVLFSSAPNNSSPSQVCVRLNPTSTCGKSN